jgi:hypothetical protein
MAAYRDAFAVRERLGDPRVVPGFHCSIRPDMPPSLTPREFDRRFSPEHRRRHAFAMELRAWHFQQSRNPFRAGLPANGRLLLPGFRRGGHPSRRRI